MLIERPIDRETVRVQRMEFVSADAGQSPGNIV